MSRIPDLDHGPAPLPASPFYALRPTMTAGRAVFATTTISPNTLILSTASPATSAADSTNSTLDVSPLAWLIQRRYRKEACAGCFAYDRGREWKLKVSGHECGVVFCSQVCLNAWLARNGEIGVQAWEAFETGVKAILKRRATDEVYDVEEVDVHSQHCEAASSDEQNVMKSRKKPSDEIIEQEWAGTQLLAQAVISAKSKERPGKNERKVLRRVLEDGGDPDIMYYLLTAVIAAYNAHASSPTLDPTSTLTLLSPLFHLTPTSTAYRTSHTSLPLYTTSHLYLLSLLPASLTPYLTTTLSHNLNTRAAYNAFSIRPPPTLDGPESGEFLGWAVYPTASFFNHSCAPNLRKVRKGRVWEFSTTREVQVGEELCITYLGGEEVVLSVQERRGRLSAEWGFECACVKCTEETGCG